MLRIITSFMAVLCAVAFVGTPVFGQGVTTSAMRGTVLDDQGSPLPGANVLAVHTPSGTTYGAATGVDGTYNIRNMRVGGPYRITTSFIGFADNVKDNVYLRLGDTYRHNVTLRDQSVELAEVVVLGGGVFDAERTGVGTNIDEQALANLPSLGRDLADFTRLTPQAVVGNDDDDGPSISIAGQNNRYNSIYIDGAVNNDVFGLSAQGTNGGQTGSTPISIDAIEEFQIALSPFDVTQSGFTGGAINAVTRSGTNRFEGSAYYFNRNQNFVGKTPTALAGSDERTKIADFSNNRFGFRVGGPIQKDKLFFFTNVEILRSESPQPFSTYTGDSASRIGSIQQTLIDELGYNPGGFGDKSSTLDDNKVLVKLDYNINNNHKLSARHSYSKADNIDAFGSDARDINFENNSEVFPNTTNSTAVELNSVFGNDYANKLIVGFTRVKDDRGFAGDPFPLIEIDDGSGTITIGSEPFSTANILEQDIFTITNNFNWFRGKHTLTIGTHNEFYDIGNLFIARNFGTYEYGSLDDFLQSVCAAGSGSSAGCATYGPNPVPVAPDVYQRGYSLVDNIAGDGTSAIGAFKAYQLGLYVQDEYQVNEQLRVTAGIRVDVPKVTSEPRFAADVFDTTIPAVSAQYDLNGAAPGKTPKAAPYISPRIGFNYDLGDGETMGQLRGGVGVFTGRVPFVWPGSMFLNNGTNSGFVFIGGGEFPDESPIPLITDPNAQPTGSDFGNTDVPSGRLEIFEEDFKYPQVLRTSLGVDYELPGNVVATVEGQYTKTLKGILVTNVALDPDAITTMDGPDQRPIYAPGASRLDSRYSAIHRVGNTSDGYTYDISARLSKSMRDVVSAGDNLDLSLAYTYGDSYVVNDGTSSQINTLWRSMETGNYLNNTLEQTRSDFSIGSRVVANATFRKQFLNNLATTISLFYVGESGVPFSYTIDNSGSMVNASGGRDFSLFYVPNDASDLTFIPDGSMSAAQQAAALDRYIESSDYLSSRRGQYAERNGSRSPMEHVVDVHLAQELFGDLGGRRQKVEVTLDIFNVGNLINKDWGQRYNGFTSSSNGGFEIIEFNGFVDEGSGNLTPQYQLNFNSTTTPTESTMWDSRTKDSGTFSSRWQMQLGFRYTF